MRLRTPATALLLASLLALIPAPGHAGEEGPGLDQTLDELAIVHGKRVLEGGHVDLGPKFDGDTWRFLVHDDVARADADATSVWRYPDETVFRVLDAGRLTVPDDPAYSFLGAAVGAPVWVVPQTQNPEVVWLGWNTQDPQVMQTIDRGVTLSLTGVQGPGTATVYLQSGTFGEPQVLWDSRSAETQPLWVDVNTHTHANWVFTEPGVYLMRLKAEADLVDGTHVSDTQHLRFAVGTDTSTDEALATTWSGPPEPAETPAGATAGAAADAAATDPSSESPLVPILVGAIALVALALIVGFGAALARSSRERTRILSNRTTTAPSDDRGNA